MHTNSTSQSRRVGLRAFLSAQAVPAVLLFAALAFPSHAVANPFAATTLSPSSQTAVVGTPCSVDIVLAVPAGGYVAYGIDATVNFDPSLLQVASVTPGGSSPFTNVGTNTVDNTNGSVRFAATGSNVSNATFAVATIVFQPVAAGTSALHLHAVNEDIAGYGPYGVDGSAVGGSITIKASAPLFFADSLTGPSSPNLNPALPTTKYGYTTSGLKRIQSDSATDRPMVTTGSSAYLGASNFVAELTVTVTNDDLLFFGVGQGDTDAGYDNEPSHAFYFRVHNNFQNYYGIQADVRSSSSPSDSGYQAINEIGQYQAGSTINLRIMRIGDSVTMSVVGGGSVTYSLSQYSDALGLTDSNTLVFFGNTNVGSVFSSLKIYPMPAPVVASETVNAGYGSAFSYQISATNSPTGYAATGLPSGLSVNTSTGAISGTLPGTLGTAVIGLSATNLGGTGTGTLTLNIVDLTPPVITAPANITAEATGPGGAAVTFAASANDAISGSVPVTANPASGSTFPLGYTVDMLTAVDAAGNQATASFSVTVQDTTPPTIAAPANITAEATSASGVVVSFAATANDLVDGPVAVNASPASGSTFPLGTTAVILTAADAHGNTATGTFNVTVRDTTPPKITSVTPSIASIWPPNKKMVAVSLKAIVSDSVGVASLKIISVSTNEPDGNVQWQITGPLTVNLLADRLGTGTGRIYTITVEARDAAGNVSTKTCTVTVPHDQGK